MKYLYRSRENRIVFGVLGGLGEYYGVDPVLLRIFWVLLLVFTGFFPGIFVYLLWAMIVPVKPADPEIKQ